MKWNELYQYVPEYSAVEIKLEAGWTAPAGHGIFEIPSDVYLTTQITESPLDPALFLTPVYVGYENTTTPKENSIHFKAECYLNFNAPTEEKDICITNDEELWFYLGKKDEDSKFSINYDFIKWWVDNGATFYTDSIGYFTIELDEPPSDCEVKYNEKTIAKINSGQTAIIKCAGCQMLTDVEVICNIEIYDGDFEITGGEEETKLITFTVDVYDDDVYFYAEEGMTWEEFISSEYNTLGWTIVDGCVCIDDSMSIQITWISYDETNTKISASDVIIATEYVAFDTGVDPGV